MFRLECAPMFGFYLKWLLLGLIYTCLSGCMRTILTDNPSYAEESSSSLSENLIKAVNRNFYADFVAGDWYYQGAAFGDGVINAYIQIPQKLNMDTNLQVHYLREAICPKSDQTELWSQLQGVNLAVHIYTFSKIHSVSAECTNPLKRQS